MDGCRRLATALVDRFENRLRTGMWLGAMRREPGCLLPATYLAAPCLRIRPSSASVAGLDAPRSCGEGLGTTVMVQFAATVGSRPGFAFFRRSRRWRRLSTPEDCHQERWEGRGQVRRAARLPPPARGSRSVWRSSSFESPSSEAYDRRSGGKCHRMGRYLGTKDAPSAGGIRARGVRSITESNGLCGNRRSAGPLQVQSQGCRYRSAHVVSRQQHSDKSVT
jgi:hypothetical protein